MSRASRTRPAANDALIQNEASDTPAPHEAQGSKGNSPLCLCRFCRAPLRTTFVDLGTSPLCESYVSPDRLHCAEPFYPLHAFVCERCLLVQLLEYVGGEAIFSEYAYFSSYSDSWLAHCRAYVDQMTAELKLGDRHQVVEVASNDGYLLQYFQERGIPCLGIEPAANVAVAAEQRGVPTRVAFFGKELAGELVKEGIRADLLLGNNVLAHVPDLNDFVAGLKVLLAPGGRLTMEFPHLQRLVEGVQFDTIYHEHFCYFSLHSVSQVFASHGLALVDVEELSTHGGSLRVHLVHQERGLPASQRVRRLEEQEHEAGYDRLSTYTGFGQRVAEVKCRLLQFLITARQEGKRVAAYGAPGKGNTLLNYCGVGPELIEYTVDRNPYKQGQFLPGTRIPIDAPEVIDQRRPDYLVVLPWNLKDEILAQMQHVREWGCRFVIPLPEVEVC